MSSSDSYHEPPVLLSLAPYGPRNYHPPLARRVLPLPPNRPLSVTEQKLQDQRDACWKRFHNAARSGDLEIFKSIFAELRQDQYANQVLDERLDTCLNDATKGRNLNIISFLLENGAVVGRAAEVAIRPVGDFVSNRLKDKALERKITYEIFRTFDMLFDHGLDLQDFPNILYSVADHEPTLKYLLSKGADPNSFSDFGDTVLSRTSNETSMKILVDHGADLSRENLLHDALELRDDQNWKEYMKFVIEVLGVDINALAVYAAEGYIPRDSRYYAKWALAKGRAGTALHWAVRGFNNSRKLEMIPKVEYLLELGADVDIRDDQGLKPVDYAKDQEMRKNFEIHDASLAA